MLNLHALHHAMAGGNHLRAASVVSSTTGVDNPRGDGPLVRTTMKKHTHLVYNPSEQGQRSSITPPVPPLTTCTQSHADFIRTCARNVAVAVAARSRRAASGQVVSSTTGVAARSSLKAAARMPSVSNTALLTAVNTSWGTKRTKGGDDAQKETGRVANEREAGKSHG
jgi:hypothetical protein